MVGCVFDAICSLDSGTSEATFTPLGGTQLRRLYHLRRRKTLENQLRDSIAARESDGLSAAILKNDSEFAPVIRVDGPRTVRECDTMT